MSSTSPPSPGDDNTVQKANPSIASAVAGEGERAQEEKTRKVDFLFVPIPKRLHYHPERHVHFGFLLNAVFALATTFVGANLYYCQPILIQLASAFHTDYDRISRIPTLALAGYGAGLLLVAPLGDLVPRRPLLLGSVFIALTLTIGLCITNSLVAFEVLTFFVGMFSNPPQILIPLAADLALPHRRASAFAIILSGLLFGVLLARLLGGLIAEFASWRDIYYMALGVQGAVLVALWATIPDFPSKNPDLTYVRIMGSMVKLAATEPTLVQAYLISVASSCTFAGFWVTLTYLLGNSPYSYSTLVIGLFGIVGMAGVVLAPFVGRLVDKMVPWYGTLFATVLMLFTAAIYWGAAGVNVAAVVIVTIGIDVFRQLQQVSLATSVLSIDPHMRARLNSVYILSQLVGQAVGSSVCTTVYVKYGWRAVGALMFALSAVQIPMLLVRGPHTQRYTWFGFEGGFEFWKSVVQARNEAREERERSEREKTDGDSVVRKQEGVPQEKIADEKRDEFATQV
ncbi:MFS general substrate transporter [Peniophora sp. CONT]|nr:MFS general substrate transporter [Peniophora sp. CONT]